MKRLLPLVTLVFLTLQLNAQVGINNINPGASLDITASNQTTPANNDGLLIPRIDAFPAVNPTAAQNSMIVYLTTLDAGNPPGFYFWNQTTLSWDSLTSAGADEIDELTDGINDGSSVFLGLNSGASDNGSNLNTAVGNLALRDIVSGTNNVGIGNSALLNTTGGNSNTAMGSTAMSNNLSGGQNTAVGYQSQRLATSASFNTGLGANSLQNNTADNNTAIGYNSLNGNTSGTNSTAVGYQSLSLNSTGSENTAVGAQALFRNSTAGFNTAVGSLALTSNTTGDSNTAVGRAAFGTNSTGNDNTGFGYHAGVLNSTGYQNTAIGSSSLDANSTGYDNTAVGFGSLGSNSNGRLNSAVGSAALSSNSGGIENTAVGAGALSANNVGNYNTAVGSGALSGLSRASGNIAVGHNALSNPSATVGFLYNIAVGSNSLSSLTAGSRNIALGDFTLEDLSSGLGNIGIGSEALRSNTTASYNTAIGFNSGLDNTTGTQNVFLGYRSGFNMSTGSLNTFVGANAGLNNSAGVRNVFIGYNAGLSELGNDRLYIDNSNTSNPLIWGHFGLNELRINGNLQVGNPAGTGYEFPAADGTANQVLQTDGTGNIAWASISAADDQTIDTFSFNTSTNELSLEIENDGVAAQTVDLSNLDIQNTLDNAYDEGGAGSGRIIDADGGAVTIAGTDGLLVTGNFSTGAVISVSGAGDRMFFNPRKAAFRAGTVGSGGLFDSTAWDEINVGNRSFAVNAGTIASASYSFASGLVSEARGVASTAMGYGTIANDDYEMAVGEWNTVTIGRSFVVGNGTSDVARSDSFEVFTDGRVTINEEYTLPTTDGSSNQVLTTNGFGTAFWSTPSFTDATTSSNGLSESADDIQLGGSLTQNTTITQGTFNMAYNLDSTGYFEVQNSGTPEFRVDPSGNTFLGGNLLINQSSVTGTPLLALYGAAANSRVDMYNAGALTNRLSGFGDSYFNGGSVGFGNNNPNYQIDVTDNTAGFVAQFENENLAATADGVRITLGATTPNASGYYIGFYRDGGASLAGRISGLGTGVQLVSVSDARLKTNFENVSGALQMIREIDPQWYEFKSDLGQREMGFLAQNLKKILPQLVAGDENSDPNTDPMMVDYSRITPLLTAGIQELEEKVTALEAENAELRLTLKKYEALEARITALESDKNLEYSSPIVTDKKE